MRAFSRVLGAVSVACFLGLGIPNALAAFEDVIPAIILKVEGDGIANLRKKSGVVEVAGARGKVFVGDRIITDQQSVVDLMLNDGSVIKIGFNSEFTLQKVENKRKNLSWIFRLVRGSIRALVEKVPSKETHLRIETESGTIGVRGTEFVLSYDPADATSSLYLLDGVVSFGRRDCEKTRTCVDVKAGEFATLPKDAPKPLAPASFTARDLLGVGKQASTPARVSLFRDGRHAQAQAAVIAAADDKALKKIVDDATVDLAAAQDRAIGRSQEQREAMHKAIKNGTYDATMAAADSFAAAQPGGFNANSNGGAENLVAQVAASKFRLGEAVRKADAAGLFLDSSPGDGSGDGAAARTYKLRKTLDFDQSAVAKGDREALSKATDDYKETLEYAEALSGDQVPAGDKPSSDKSGGDRSSRAQDGDSSSASSSPRAIKNCDESCEAARIAHELDVASEGSVNAFAAAADSSASSEGSSTRRGRTTLPGSVRTKFFRRTVPGDSCFKTQTKCKMQPCTGLSHGKKCKAGETVEVCESKQVPVRCDR